MELAGKFIEGLLPTMKGYGFGTYSTNPQLNKLGQFFNTVIDGSPFTMGDETGSVSFNPMEGGFSINPYNSFGLNVKGNDIMRGGGPSAELTFQFGQQRPGFPMTEIVDGRKPAVNQERGRLLNTLGNLSMPEASFQQFNPLSGSRIVVDERGYTRRVP